MKKTIAVCILALAVALSGCGLLQNMPKPPQTTDVPVSAEPVSETPQQGGDISYHLRSGEHNLTPYDWNVYMDFADRHGWRCARGQGKEEAGE